MSTSQEYSNVIEIMEYLLFKKINSFKNLLDQEKTEYLSFKDIIKFIFKKHFNKYKLDKYNNENLFFDNINELFFIFPILQKIKFSDIMYFTEILKHIYPTLNQDSIEHMIEQFISIKTLDMNINKYKSTVVSLLS